MSLRAPTLLCLTLTAGCIFGGDGEPRDGLWIVEAPVIETNDCSIDITPFEIDALASFYLFQEFDMISYTLLPTEENADEIDCSLLGSVLSCDDSNFTVPLGPTLLDVSTELSVADFSRERRIDFTETFEFDCEGDAGCTVAKDELKVEDFPCILTRTLEANWESEDLGPLTPDVPEF